MKVDVRTRHQLWKDMYGNEIDKAAELAGTYDMPQTKPAVDPNGKKAVVVKTAEEREDDALKLAFAVDLDVNLHTKPPSEIPNNAPQTHLKPHVDVSGKDPVKRTMVKKAERYALPLDERYPLDGYDQVKTASAYFDENMDDMPPNVRRVFCENMVKRADELGIKTSEVAQRYASNRYADTSDIAIAIDTRRHSITNEDHLGILNKVASARPHLLPEQFADLLFQFDKMANITHLYGTYVLDPYLSTLGKTAAQESETDPKASIILGNEYVTVRKLVELSKLRQSAVMARFGKEFALAFTRDPKGIFDSLPRDQKIVMMRLANNNDSAREGASTS